MSNEKNVLHIRESDRQFIKFLQNLPPDKQILARGIVIGMNLPEKREVCTK